jgi:periplasmic protein TonB
VRLAALSPRLAVGCAIALAHALAIYGLVTLAPSGVSSATDRPMVVHFIPRAEARPAMRPPEPATVTPVVIVAVPDMPLIDYPEAVASSERAISAPQRSVDSAPIADRSIPRLVSAVEYVREPSPRYPAQSRRLGEQGIVVLRVVIDERGRACDIEIESSSGHERLDRAAREAVATAAFRPYLEDGAPRRALVLIPIEFFLNRRSV